MYFLAVIGGDKASPEAVKDWIYRWKQSGRTIEMLVETPQLTEPPSPTKFSDLYDYGVERILILQHDRTVDLYIKNQWHVELNTLILSESGYPSYLLPIAEQALNEQPNLPVFLLHDADFEGRAMLKRLQESPILPLSGHPVVDIGLSLKDKKRIKRLRHWAGPPPMEFLPILSLTLGLKAGMDKCMELPALQEHHDVDGQESLFVLDEVEIEDYNFG